ncbi:putative bifunctional diguanylate cyclase/phosphodiesterase [Roseivivax isoporae]|uniref:Diguanylate cyclase n=1 Tax=Roseivivax isoporae LMG 25204 TaxID=1449351 RepID=X7FCG4_9RHOB|nr:GGDEF domain-containing phosphodiesterase [Roseivivax isoporae]ETX30567.1 diguanylate cyclase [Roseivivax isoporae LMG 25204]
MIRKSGTTGARAGTALRRLAGGPWAVAVVAAAVLGAWWIGGEPLLLAASLCTAVILATATATRPPAVAALPVRVDRLDIPRAEALAGRLLRDADAACLATGCVAMDVEGIAAIGAEDGERAASQARDTCLARLRGALRAEDAVFAVGDQRFLALLAPGARLDTESLTDLGCRLQAALEEPLRLDRGKRYLTASLGICGSDRLGPGASGESLLDAALSALSEASRQGRSAIRVWSSGLCVSQAMRDAVRSGLPQALENGEIQPWFQPQICTSTGRISGVEALARWVHPDYGVISPAQFLDAAERGGHMPRLGDVIRRAALAALRDWDAQGLDIPRVGINLSARELRDPTFPEKLKWDLDRYGLDGKRLVVEVLETVLAVSGECEVARVAAQLKALGCGIDLDDFGTGNQSILSLQRLPADRIKIDRSFVARIDRDPAQRRMVCALLSLADQLGIATLAEGVESAGEHALLAQLGCDHVQGFGIARPMPATQFADWARRHAATLGTLDPLPGTRRKAR